MKRVYHPTLDSWTDVDDALVAAWVEAGWLKTQPKHVTIPDGTPAPGEHPGIASVPVEPTLETVAPEAPRTTTGRGSGAGTSTTPAGGKPAR